MNGIHVKENDAVVFDSTKKHLLLDLNSTPKSFGITTITGTALAIVGSGTVSEVVLTLPHGKPYVPHADFYFYPTSTTVDTDQFGLYYKNFFSYATLGGTTEDSIVITHDANNFIFTHKLDTPTSYTSDAPAQPLAVKFYIYSIPAYDSSYVI